MSKKIIERDSEDDSEEELVNDDQSDSEEEDIVPEYEDDSEDDSEGEGTPVKKVPTKKEPVKRGRGRPPKAGGPSKKAAPKKTVPKKTISRADDDSEEEVPEKKRGPGRPPKKAKVEVEDSDEDEGEEETIMSGSVLREADPTDPENVKYSKDLIPFVNESYEEFLTQKKIGSKKLKLHFDSKEIFAIQYVIGSVFLKSEGVTFLRAFKGFGKTLLACSIALRTKRCLISVKNTNLNNPWIEQIKKYGLYDPDPEESDILIFDAKTEKHKRYLDSLEEYDPNKRLIIISKESGKATAEGGGGLTRAMEVFRRVGLGGNEFTVIVDEAAYGIKTQLIQSVQPFVVDIMEENRQKKKFEVTRELLMSGEPLDTGTIGFNTQANKRRKAGKSEAGFVLDHKITVTGKLATRVALENMPKDTWHIKDMATESVADGAKEWALTVRNILKSQDNVTIVASQGDFDLLTENGAFRGKQKFEYKTSTAVVDKFLVTGDAYLYIKRSITGINIRGPAMIIVDPSKLGTASVSQASGRLMRYDNPYDTVDFYILCGTVEDRLKAFYAKTFSYQGWEFGRDEKLNLNMVYKAISIIKLLSGDVLPDDVSRIDLCVIIGNYVKIVKDGEIPGDPDILPETIIKWWRENLELVKRIREKLELKAKDKLEAELARTKGEKARARLQQELDDKYYEITNRSDETTILTEDNIRDIVYWI